MSSLIILKAKIVGTDGNVLKKFLNKNYIQKYLNEDEIKYVESLPGDTWVDKLEYIKNTEYDIKEEKQPTAKKEDPKYVIDGVSFSNVMDLARFVYCKENNIDAVAWVRKTKGPKFFKQHRKKTNEDFKRKVLEINRQEDIPLKVWQRRNDNIKIKLYCTECGRADFQSPKTVLHFNNLLCKSCRRKQIKNHN